MAVARWRGLLALVGIVVAFGVLVVFCLPALRDGAPAVPVALVASAAILYAVIHLAHGVNLRTSAAYAGSSLPLLLLFSVANRSLVDVLTGESVAIELVRSAVGGIALALSVPLTTAIAAVLAKPSAEPAGVSADVPAARAGRTRSRT